MSRGCTQHCKLAAQLIVHILNEGYRMWVVELHCLEGYLHPIGYVMSIFALYPMVEGSDSIPSALERFDPLFRFGTSIGLYSVDISSGGVRGSSYRSLSGPMSAMVGCGERVWSKKNLGRKAAGANLTCDTLHVASNTIYSVSCLLTCV